MGDTFDSEGWEYRGVVDDDPPEYTNKTGDELLVPFIDPDIADPEEALQDARRRAHLHVLYQWLDEAALCTQVVFVLGGKKYRRISNTLEYRVLKGWV